MAKNAQQFEERPWGTFEVIAEFEVETQNGTEQVVVKKLVVYPNKRLSYQRHKLRNEHWHIVQGQGMIVLDDVEQSIEAGHKIHVPTGTKHRIANTHDSDNLIFIEITGGQFDEFDNERLEDDFGR